MKTIIAYIAFVVLAWNGVAAGTEPYIEKDLPVLKNVSVEATISYDENGQLYYYSYAIANPPANTGEISIVELDISKPLNSEALSSEGLIITVGVNRSGKIISRPFDIEVTGRAMQKEVIPIGAKPPKGWISGISARGTTQWGCVEDESCITPDKVLNGFEMRSRGIPTISNMIIHPHWVLTVSDSVSEEDVELSRSIKKEIAFYTKTVGPTAPPKDLNYQDFLNSIISMKHEAYALGWITNEGVERSLDAKLDAAKKKLLSGGFVPARKLLDAFVNEVEAQGCESYDNCPKGKHLKPEAYALLKYNALYLIDHLK